MVKNPELFPIVIILKKTLEIESRCKEFLERYCGIKTIAKIKVNFESESWDDQFKNTIIKDILIQYVIYIITPEEQKAFDEMLKQENLF